MMHCKILLPKLPKLTFLFVFGVSISGLVLYCFLTSRVRDMASAKQVAMVAHLPKYNSRCRRFNSTHFSCLPNVIFIGASKCGTTSLSDYLNSHPHVYFIRRHVQKRDKHREVHRFDRNTFNWAFKPLELAEEWALAPVVRDPRSLIVHYTPHYLYAPTVPYEMRDFYPNSHTLKFIVLLREPTKRTVSSYWFKTSSLFKGVDEGSAEELERTVASQIRQRKLYEACLSSRGSDWRDPTPSLIDLRACFGPLLRSPLLGERHVDKSIYADQLMRWFTNFPRSNFYVVTLEKFAADPRREFNLLLRFLRNTSDEAISSGIDQGNLSLLSEADAKWTAQALFKKLLVSPNKRGSANAIPEALNRTLHDFFYPYNMYLERLLDTRLGWNR